MTATFKEHFRCIFPQLLAVSRSPFWQLSLEYVMSSWITRSIKTKLETERVSSIENLKITITEEHRMHYEQNWFNQWPFSETHPNSTFPVGQNNKKAARPDKPWGFWAPCHLFCVFGLILPFYQYISAKLILPSISQNGHCLNQFCSQCNDCIHMDHKNHIDLVFQLFVYILEQL